MTHISVGKRLAATVGVAALAVTGFAGTAFAADTNPATTQNTGSITLTKYDGGVSTTAGTGKETTVTGRNTLSGVGFKKVEICYWNGSAIAHADLSTQEGWTAIKDLKVSDVITGTTLTTPDADHKYGSCDGTLNTITEQKTDNNGQIKWTGLALHPYLIVETTLPEGASPVSQASPFIVTVPLANTTSDKTDNPWIYDVYVYPKNQLQTSVTKTFDADNTHLGDVASSADVAQYTISAILPSYTEGKTAFEKVELSDLVPANFRNVTVVANSVKLNDVALDAAKYEVTGSPANNGDTAADATLTVALKGEGLTDAKPGNKLSFQVTGQLVGAGAVINDAKLVVDQQAPTRPTGGDKPVAVYGSFDITKVAKGETTNKLGGASFKVCKANAAGDACETEGSYLKPYVANGTAEDSVFTTATSGDAKGTVSGSIKLAEGKISEIQAGPYKYCVVETTAPEGYILDPTPSCFSFSVTTNTNAGTVTVTPTDASKTIENTAYSFPVAGLPLTGAQGQLILTLGGAAIVLVGLGAVMVLRRRQAQH